MRLIDADALKETLESSSYWTYTHEYGDAIPVGWVMSAIDNAPSVPLPDFKEGYKQAIIDGKTNFSRPQGEWIFHKDFNESCRYGCNQCGNLNNIPSNFCPNCGARMVKE